MDYIFRLDNYKEICYNSFMKNYLLEYSEQLAVSIANICDSIENERNICFQIKKSSSSIYANIREANYGQSAGDMISKFEIALKETSETEGWLNILFKSSKIDEDVFKNHRNLCGRIQRLLISSIRTLDRKSVV